MQSNIEVKFLTPEEMENAFKIDSRYEHVQKDNLGFADPVKNRVFVRAGLDADLTKYLINHEVSHLFELEGSEEDENGIRHKNSSWLLPTLLSVAGAVMGAPYGLLASIPLAAAGFGGGELGNAMGTSKGGLTGGIGNLGATLGGVAGSFIPGMGGIGSAVGTGLGKMFGNDIQEQLTSGRPQWGQSAIQGLESGASKGVENMIMGAMASPQMVQGTDVGISGTNRQGESFSPSTGSEAFEGTVSGNPQNGWGSTLTGMAAGNLTNQAFGMLNPQPSYGQMFNTNASGMGNFNVPTQGMTPGFTPGTVGGGSAGTGGQQGSLAQMAGNAGVGQAGIALGAQQGMPNTGQTGAQGQNFQNMGMDKAVGFNPMNGGSITFGTPSNMENKW